MMQRSAYAWVRAAGGAVPIGRIGWAVPIGRIGRIGWAVPIGRIGGAVRAVNGGGSILVGRPGFKPGGRRHALPGGFDSHAPPPPSSVASCSPLRPQLRCL